MEFKGTEGTWQFVKWDGDEWPEKRWSIASGIRGAIAISPKYFTESKESEANAKLMAASKDLLEMCIEVYRYMDDGDEPIRGEILKAINKALK